MIELLKLKHLINALAVFKLKNLDTQNTSMFVILMSLMIVLKPFSIAILYFIEYFEHTVT